MGTKGKMFVIINKGTRHEISESTLQKLRNRNSPAGEHIAKTFKENKDTREFSFHRNTSCTRNIQEYFNGDVLHMPNDVCPDKFKEEIEFWGLHESAIGSCCYNKYVSYFEEQEALHRLECGEMKRKAIKERVQFLSNGKGFIALKARVWQVMEYPSTSVKAKVFLVVSSVFVILSLFVMIANSHPEFKRPLAEEEWKEFFGDETFNIDVESNETSQELPDNVMVTIEYIQYLKWIILAYFTAEILCKIIFFPLSWKEFFTFLNIVDMLAVAVSYLEIFANETTTKEKYQETFYDGISSLQVVRVFRLFRLAKYISGFRVLVFTLKASATDLLLMFLCLFTAILMFSSLAYFSRDSAFSSIPDSAWWAIITLTTVGYGDIVPKTVPGKLVASMCAITGICMLAMLIPTLVNNFLLLSTHIKVIERRGKENKNTETCFEVKSLTPVEKFEIK